MPPPTITTLDMNELPGAVGGRSVTGRSLVVSRPLRPDWCCGRETASDLRADRPPYPSAGRPEVLPQLARGLRRHAVRRPVAAGQLEGHPQGRAARPRPARQRALAPVLAHRHHVEAGEGLLQRAVVEVAQETHVVAALRLLR